MDKPEPAHLQKQKGFLIPQKEKERQKLPLVQGVLTTNVNCWAGVHLSPVETNYPCTKCGCPRTEDQGGTTFPVCDDCWDHQRP